MVLPPLNPLFKKTASVSKKNLNAKNALRPLSAPLFRPAAPFFPGQIRVPNSTGIPYVSGKGGPFPDPLWLLPSWRGESRHLAWAPAQARCCPSPLTH